MKPLLLAATALIVTTAGLETADAARRKVAVPDKFDGNWSIRVVTEDGPCDRAYRYGVQIERGQARYAGGEFAINGRVAPNGMVRAVISRGPSNANVVGRLASQGLGRGTWTTDGLISCSGSWSATRRG